MTPERRAEIARKAAAKRWNKVVQQTRADPSTIMPAMAANLTDRLWGWEEFVASMDAAEQPKKRGAYKKRTAV